MLFKEETRLGWMLRDYDVEITNEERVNKIILGEKTRIEAQEPDNYMSYTIATVGPLIPSRNRAGLNRGYLLTLEKNDVKSQLINLLHGMDAEENRQVLYGIIRKLASDKALLERFLRTYHPDIQAFKEILPYIELVIREEHSVQRIEGALVSARHDLWRMTGRSDTKYSRRDIINQESLRKRISTLEDRVNTASMNSEIEEGLCLNFKRRSK